MGQTVRAMSMDSIQVSTEDSRDRNDNNNNLKEENIQEIIEIGTYQEDYKDYKPLIIIDNNIDSIKQAKLNLILM